MSKYVFVLGGVFSGTGKGISAASMALLMKMRGLKVQVFKFDPYLNTSASVLSPREHGETFVCDDGTETDLDLGNYERIAGVTVSKNNIYTNGRIYKELIEEQERGEHGGRTVQICPQYVNKARSILDNLGKDADVVFAEVGGTIGDMESAPFLEAIRQFKQQNHEGVMICMVAPILWVPTISEFKTKPLQNSVKSLQSFGLQPDMILCRVDRPVPRDILDKVANLTNVNRTSVFEAPDVKSIYQVPIEFWQRHVDDLIADRFHFQRNGVRIHKYKDLVERYVNADCLPSVEVGIVGKYENQEEAYVSLKEALYHAGLANQVRVKRRWINAEDLEIHDCGIVRPKERGLNRYFEGLSAVIVPGGFDVRGIEGKIAAIRYCREKKIPFLGICLGLQCAIIEFARNVCGMSDANSMEFDKKTEYPVVHYVPGQEDIRKKDGTMRLGSYPCELVKDSLAISLYRKRVVQERHRHRYEVNGLYRDQLEQHGFHVSGFHPTSGLIEIMELDREIHPFFIGTQAHPELVSRLQKVSPLFEGLIAMAKQTDIPLDKKAKDKS